MQNLLNESLQFIKTLPYTDVSVWVMLRREYRDQCEINDDDDTSVVYIFLFIPYLVGMASVNVSGVL